MMKYLLAASFLIIILTSLACSEVEVEIKVMRTQEPAGTPANIILDGSSINGGRRDLDSVSLPWSYSFTSEKGKIVIVHACCGLMSEDTGITVQVYKDGFIIGSKSGYSPTVQVIL